MIRKTRNRSAEIPTASLADIAFLILIFFLATTTIDVDKGLGLTLPAKGETKDIKKKNIMNLLINQSGEVMLDNNPVEIKQIRQVIEQKLIENPSSTSGSASLSTSATRLEAAMRAGRRTAMKAV